MKSQVNQLAKTSDDIKGSYNQPDSEHIGQHTNQLDEQTEKPALQLVAEITVEAQAASEAGVDIKNISSRWEWHDSVTAYYWCRVCQMKALAVNARSCDCGVTMCNSCWGEWDFVCPLCEANMS